MASKRPLGTLLLAISFFRALLGGLLILFYDSSYAVLGIVILIVGQLSDHLDGFIARRYSQPSIEGYFQDSISDKLFQTAAIIVACKEFNLSFIVLWIVISRDLLLLVFRVLSQDLEKDLVSLKWVSIIFAIKLRVGILILFSLPFFDNDIEKESLFFIAEISIYMASFVGISSVIFFFKALPRKAL